MAQRPDLTVPMDRLGAGAALPMDQQGSAAQDPDMPMDRTAQGQGVPVTAGRPGAPAEAGEAAVPPQAPGAEATEALEAEKVLVAIARSEAARSSGTKAAPQRTRTGDSITPVMPPRGSGSRPGPRVVAREMQVGFGVDISQPVGASAVEARRLELVRAITGDGDTPAVPGWRAALHGRRAWTAAGLLAGAAVGLGVVWMLAGR